MSCFGKCSLTVALPILSSLGVEAVPLPTGILSTHTGGFTGYTRLDMTSEMKKIIAHWRSIGLRFDGIYTGYFANVEQINIAKDFIAEFASKDAKIIVDPVMADNGKMYCGFDERFICAMSSLIDGADIITPNITEAMFLSGVAYEDIQKEDDVKRAAQGLLSIGAKRLAITGISWDNATIGYRYVEQGHMCDIKYEKLNGLFHGCGDVFASTLAGLLMNLESYEEAVALSARFAERCILKTAEDKATKKYGLCFEECLKEGIMGQND